MTAPTGQDDTEAGVHYQCQRCGNCCRWPGDVFVDDLELVAIADYVGMKLDEFVQSRTRLRANRTGLSLVEKRNGECFFLNGVECTINPVKPAQCRGFPNNWNFPGWRDVCEAIPEARLQIPVQAPTIPDSSRTEKTEESSELFAERLERRL